MSKYPGQHFQRRFLPAIALMIAVSAQAGVPADDIDADFAAAVAAAASQTMRANAGVTRGERQSALLERAMTEGSVPVIVQLRISDEQQTGSGRAQRRAALSAAQKGMLQRIGLGGGRDRLGAPIKRFSEVPALAMQADAIDLMDLADDPEVLDVVEDIAYPPALSTSVSLVGALGGTFEGYSGEGQVIAVLDTGVDKSHPFLSGKVVSEACYSSNYTSSGVYSLCPGGVTASTAVGSALNCDTSVNGCQHGTHVAGIAAGKGSNFSGVARDARILAIQVFSRFPSSSCGGAPCVMAYTSDIIKGLERVHALRASYAIAAANLSLGGGGYTNACDSDPTKPVIDKLHAAGIATVIASGNNSYINAISAPGCISTAVTVGSTTKSDAVSSFSNSAAFLDLLAPGSSINSSVPGSSYATWNGTSMAAPHVTGAWAVLKSAKSTAGVEEVLAALKSTGQPVLDSRNNLSKPRIEVADAVAALEGAPSPSPVAPSALAASQITINGFQANWTGVADATGYRLDVSTSSTFSSFLSGHQNLDVATATARTISGLASGTNYYYRVRAYNGSGASPSSNVANATTTVAPPAAPTLTSPSGITANGFTASWRRVTGATGYRLDVSTNSAFNGYVTGYQDRKVGNVRKLAVTGLSPGTTYYYRVRASNAGGAGLSSSTRSVTTKEAIPQVPALNSVISIDRRSFTVDWNPVSGATGYRLDVATKSSFRRYVNGYKDLNVGNGTEYSVTGLRAGKTYYVRLRAYNSAGTSLDSETKVIVTPI
ncbi:S8 family serine peptidase [Thiocapsa bogorovii]|uniref:S8 family serine peptidase n=1 Tax=Thiocapsa bogorovii TaxID=521689 RepID=UPI001E4E7E74|nr:S8 family serine peptidase [Thiocapsa bogorovii]UHD14495.1 S8 family serine peptidase [Thiocapsa bogorovii]